MPLTPNQVEAVTALDWLLNDDDNRRQGRTTALAVALIRQALRHPNQRIVFLDHIHAMPYMRERGEYIIRQYVEHFIRTDPRLQTFGWNVRPHDFGAAVPAPVYDWWPDDSVFGPPPEPALNPQEPAQNPQDTAWDRLLAED